MAGGKLISTGVEFPDATTQTTSGLPLTGGALKGAVTTTSTFDGRDVAADGVTADAALPKAGGTMTGTIADFTSTGIDDNATSTAITIDASENVGIGTTSPAAELHISKSADAGNAEIILENSFTNTGSSTDESTQIQGRFGGYDASYILTGKEGDYTTAALRKSYLAFSTRTATTGMTEKLRIDSSGNVEVKTGNLVIGTSGKGIDFSAVSDGSRSVGSNILDDYEEGTWTPTIYASITGTNRLSSYVAATYIKIGNLVRCKVYLSSIDGVNLSTDSGGLRLGGMPFSSSNYGHLYTLYSTLSATYPNVKGITNDNFAVLKKGDGQSDLSPADIPASVRDCMLDLTYETS